MKLDSFLRKVIFLLSDLWFLVFLQFFSKMNKIFDFLETPNFCHVSTLFVWNPVWKDSLIMSGGRWNVPNVEQNIRYPTMGWKPCRPITLWWDFWKFICKPRKKMPLIWKPTFEGTKVFLKVFQNFLNSVCISCEKYFRNYSKNYFKNFSKQYFKKTFSEKNLNSRKTRRYFLNSRIRFENVAKLKKKTKSWQIFLNSWCLFIICDKNLWYFKWPKKWQNVFLKSWKQRKKFLNFLKNF